MGQLQPTIRLDRTVEHEGTKTPIKRYDWDEIEDIEVSDPFTIRAVDEARRAHTLIHWAWEDRALPDWTYDEMIAEHARVVSFLTDRGERHVDRDSLDTTMPESLKDRSENPDKNLLYLRTVDRGTSDKLVEAGVDSLRKLKNADPDEVAEQTGLTADYIESLQEQAEEL